MGKEDLLSIIVPNFNNSNFLSRCLDSLFKQTYKNIEIIVVDDGSTDDSKEILDIYQKKHKNIKVVYNKHAGLSETRNIGILEARGKYIGFVDADDHIESNFYEKLYESAIKTNSDIVMTSTKLFVNEKYIGILQPYFTLLATKLIDKISILRGGGM